MKRNKSGFLAAVVLAAAASLFTVCKASGAGSGVGIPGGEKVSVGWTMRASPRGGDGTATLDLGFTKAVDALVADDFTFEGTPVTAGALGGSGAVRTFSVSDVPEAGTVNVSVKKEGWTFDPPSYDWDIETGNTAPSAAMKITFDGNGGTLSGGEASIDVAAVDGKVVYPANRFARDDYGFLGWYETAAAALTELYTRPSAVRVAEGTSVTEKKPSTRRGARRRGSSSVTAGTLRLSLRRDSYTTRNTPRVTTTERL